MHTTFYLFMKYIVNILSLESVAKYIVLIVCHLGSQSLLTYLSKSKESLIIARGYKECLRYSDLVTFQLSKLGLIIHPEKSKLISQKSCCVFLGLNFNSETMTLSLPLHKKNHIFEQTLKMCRKERCTIRQLICFLYGNLIAACPIFDYGWL
nr:unnamed protein product [Callosobruchus chinensis]